MDQKIRSEWTSVLRSGEFEQGKDVLARNGRYCCLGVLCELAHRAGVLEKKSSADSTGVVYYDGERYALPESVMLWAGLSTSDPIIHGTALSSWNDGGTRFPKIADLIEENL